MSCHREEPEGRRGDPGERGAPDVPLDRHAASRLAMTAGPATAGSRAEAGVRAPRGGARGRASGGIGRKGVGHSRTPTIFR